MAGWGVGGSGGSSGFGVVVSNGGSCGFGCDGDCCDLG